MRTWLILLALVALVCAGASHQEPRASRNKRNAAHSVRSDEEVVGHPEQQHDQHDDHQEPQKPNEPTQGNGEHGDAIVLKGEEAKIKALMARKVVHESNATAHGSHSTLPGYTQYTAINVQLLTDVINGSSTGIPYLYISKHDITEKDLQQDAHATTLFSRVSIDDSCKKLPLNGVDPRCEKAILVGKMIKLEEDSDEYKAACEELVKKFSGLKNIDPKEFVVRKMDVEAVFVPDHQGKPLLVPMDIYKAVNPEDVIKDLKED